MDQVPGRTPFERTLACAMFFGAVQGVAYVMIPLVAPWINRLGKHDYHRMFFAIGSQIHAVIAIYYVFDIILGSANATLQSDKVYGTTDVTLKLQTFSCGYFLYDFFVVIGQEEIDKKFLFHAIVCGAAYYLAQGPYFQYYTTRFLLFELSTPILNTRTFLIMTNANDSLVKLCGPLFGITFVCARLLYGIPLAYDFLGYLKELIDSENDKYPSKSILYFSAFAVFSMTCLNIVWFLVTLFNPPKTDHLYKEDEKKD